MLHIFKKYKLSDLTNLKERLNVDRSSFKIAVIEDKIFPYLDELRRHSFNITVFDDIEILSTLNDFDIIISDIRGVGKHFGSSLEGAHLIQEIHKRYPNKYLIAYSSSTFNPSYNDYLRLCDETKKKSSDVNDWVNTFDNAIKKVSDPIFQWEKTRKLLLSNNVSIDDISKLEKAYAKSILKGKKNLFIKELTNKKIGGNHTELIAKSVTEFVATFLAKILRPE